MKHSLAIIMAASVFLIFLFTSPAQSCVGRVLTLSIYDTPEQTVVGQLLATYITERTGTTVELVTAPQGSSPEEQVKKNKADGYINYLDEGLAEVNGGTGDVDAEKAYSLVKNSFYEKYKMVWLKPLGYKGPVQDKDIDQTSGSLAIVVTTRQVLERFPVLDRVINKLSGRIDAQTVQNLIMEAQGKDKLKVVKDYLKDQNLI